MTLAHMVDADATLRWGGWVGGWLCSFVKTGILSLLAMHCH